MSPMIKVSLETLQAIKEYLVDIEDYTIGECVADAIQFAMENIDDFEDYIGIEETEEEGESEEEEEKTESE